MSLLIQGGEVITATCRLVADIYCANETISRIESAIDPAELPSDVEIVDARGKYVFPGFADPHTHVYLPVGGLETKDSYETASAAALVGGTTCFFDFISPTRDESPLAALAAWKARAEGRSYCDYAFHLAIPRLDDEAEAEVRQVVADGHRSFKVYLAYDGVGVDDETLVRVLQLGRELDVITCAHCENRALVNALRDELAEAGKTSPRWHAASRPPQVEADGTHHLLTFAELLQAEVYVVHVSCDQALQIARDARQRGVRVHIETLIQFLLLDTDVWDTDDFDAAKYIVSPPIRGGAHREVLWQGLQSGLIDTLATDHAPFDLKGQKDLGRRDFRCIANGMPGIEDRINLLYSRGVATGRLDPHRFVEVASTAPARIFGIYPQKGAIEVGSDADLVVYDPDYRGSISARTHKMNVDYNGYEGWSIRGRPHVVSVRGEIMARDGELVGPSGRGRLLRR